MAEHAWIVLGIWTLTLFGQASLTLKGNDFQRLVKLMVDECKSDPKMKLKDSSDRKKCPVQTEYSWACWPEKFAGENVTIDCPWTFFESGKLSRRCGLNGTWEGIGLTSCARVKAEESRRRREYTLSQYDIRTKQQLAAERAFAQRVRIQNIFLESLRYVDTVATFMALCCLIAFVGFQHIHLNLHLNLIVGFFLSGIANLAIMRKENSTAVCNGLFVSVEYLFLAQVCWMFCEGLYRFVTLYIAFIGKVSIWPFFIFAWSFPALVVFCVYLPVMKTYPPESDALGICWAAYQSYKMAYIVLGTAYAFLTVNCLFIVSILYVLMSKVRAAKSPESTVAFRGIRGFALLFVLLGGGYMITLYGPKDEWYMWLRIVVQPTQGLVVSIIYVAMSNEVWKGARRRFRLLKNSTSYALSLRSNSRTTWALSNSSSRKDAWKAKSPSSDGVVHMSVSTPPSQANSLDDRPCSPLTDLNSDEIRLSSDMNLCVDILNSVRKLGHHKFDLENLCEEMAKGSHANEGFCDAE